MIILLFLLLAFSFQYKPVITREYIEQLSKEVDWEVESYENSLFKGWTMEDFLTSFPKYEELDTPLEISADAEPTEEDRALPERFDGRTKWGKCIHPIRRQGQCGSCWACTLTEFVSDRFCIKGKDVILSPAHLVACCKEPGVTGCLGGNLPNTMDWVIKNGVVTETCYPYKLADTKTTPPCPTACPGKGNWKERYHCKAGSKRIVFTIPKMKAEIMDIGPVGTWFAYRLSFNQYKSGIYKCEGSQTSIGHYMKVIGWGVENNIHYWIIANSFGTAWGEKGFVRFMMGKCGIDDKMFACDPQL